MIFISQSGLTDNTRAAEWDRWYIEHLHAMASVPGISSAQRFKTDMPGFSPSFSVYSVASAAVFDTPYYLSVRGFGEWLSLIDRRYYKRNLFDGIDEAPLAAADSRLLVADRERPADPGAGVEFIWLKSVGLDRSTPYRGLAVVDAARPLPHEATIVVYRPVTARISGSAR